MISNEIVETPSDLYEETPVDDVIVIVIVIGRWLTLKWSSDKMAVAVAGIITRFNTRNWHFFLLKYQDKLISKILTNQL